jgi:hypothetical protein
MTTADWQLGMTRDFLSDEAQARFTAARIEAITTIGALAVPEDSAAMRHPKCGQCATMHTCP